MSVISTLYERNKINTFSDKETYLKTNLKQKYYYFIQLRHYFSCTERSSVPNKTNQHGTLHSHSVCLMVVLTLAIILDALYNLSLKKPVGVKKSVFLINSPCVF